MRIGLDLDGVMYDFVACSRRACELAYPDRVENFAGDAETWDFFSAQWALSATEFWDAVVAYDHTFNSQPLGDGWVRLFEALRADGHSIHAVTARMIHWSNTLAWFGRTGLQFDSVHFVADKSLVDVDVLVDDSPENLAALHGHPRRPTWLVVFDQPWNRSVEVANFRVRGADQLGDVLHSIATEHAPALDHARQGSAS